MKLFLTDRDGVINYDSPEYIKSADEWHPIEGSVEAMARLHKAGWTVCVVSNQSAIGRGLMTIEDLTKIHLKLQHLLQANGAQVAGFFFCPHSPEAHCHCRKPATGLLEDIALRFDTDLQSVPFVGDTMKDLLAAKAVGATPILVRSGKGEQALTDPAFPSQVAVYDNLAEVASVLIGEA